jgi:maltooligosyltrehalose trehalohydrolase
MFRIWAPYANTLQLSLRNQHVELAKDDEAWWSAPITLEHGEPYTLEVNGQSGIPDPRSPWQRDGVHGPSYHVDHDRFEWHDTNWQARPLSSAVIYELHVGTFTPEGTFDAAIERLDHLAELGITHVELMPVASFLGSRGWGYDGVALYAPHQACGGPEALKRLVDACHARGLAVLLDVVYNHLGPSGNYLPQFGPYFSARHSTPWGAALNFDGPHSDEVRRFFCDNALMWLRDYHFDGLRLDAVHAIVDTSAIPFLEQLATEVEDLEAHLGRHLVLIAESDLNDPRIIRPRALGGCGIDAQWSDDIHHALHTMLTGERDGYYADFGLLDDLACAMQQPYIYAGKRSSFRARTHGRPPLGLDGRQFVAYMQNHDQLGNRAHGERICQLTGIDCAKIGAALILTSPYVPMLFQGEEWGAKSPFLYFVDFKEEPDLARAVSEGRCREFSAFGWDPEEIPDPNSEETFERSKLNWRDLDKGEHKDMLDWYKSLIQLRRSLPPLAAGRLDLVRASADVARRLLVMDRGPVRVVCNFSDENLALPSLSELDRVLLASNEDCTMERGLIRVPGSSVAIIGDVGQLFDSARLQQNRTRTPTHQTVDETQWSEWFMTPSPK